MNRIKKILVILISLCIITSQTNFIVDALEKDEYGQVYEKTKPLKESNYFSKYTIKEELHNDAKEKFSAMEENEVLVPLTDSKYEVALAHQNGDYTYVDKSDDIDKAKKIVNTIETEENMFKTMPVILNENGQVVYATYSMGKVWKHIDGEPMNNNYTSNIYSDSSLSSAYTYINQGYIDDVPIIEDRGDVAKVQVNGIQGWMNKNTSSNDYDLLMVPVNQVSNPSHYYVRDGVLYHYISKNMTNTSAGGHSISIGIAPSYLKENYRYLSYDGMYFYDGSNTPNGLVNLMNDLKSNSTSRAVNQTAFYNYYNYLPFRTKTNYSAAELNMFIADNTSTTSKLRNIGEALIKAQDKYGVNALLILGVAINESGWGMSKISQEKNNIFGIKAYDTNPGESATTFETVQDCINEFAKYYISVGYSDPQDWRYFGGFLGNKKVGANVKYASDPFWGEKAAQFAFKTDYYLAGYDINKMADYNNYIIVVNKRATNVINSSGDEIYNTKNLTDLAVAINKKNTVTINGVSYYEINPERETSVDTGEFDGIYAWNYKGYIKSDAVRIVNEASKNSTIYPREDLNNDGKIDVLDLAILSSCYNKKYGEDKYIKIGDLNSDNIIDLFDIVLLSSKIS